MGFFVVFCKKLALHFCADVRLTLLTNERKLRAVRGERSVTKSNQTNESARKDQ